MIRAYMTEEEIRTEAEARWSKLTDGRVDMESITPFDITYTRQSMLEDTKRLADRANKIDQRAQEMLQDAIDNSEEFQASIAQAKEEGCNFRASNAKRAIHSKIFDYVKTLDKNVDGIEISAAGLVMNAAVEYLKAVARA